MPEIESYFSVKGTSQAFCIVNVPNWDKNVDLMDNVLSDIDALLEGELYTLFDSMHADVTSIHTSGEVNDLFNTVDDALKTSTSNLVNSIKISFFRTFFGQCKKGGALFRY